MGLAADPRIIDTGSKLETSLLRAVVAVPRETDGDCAQNRCLPALVFDWSGGGFTLEPADQYVLPASIKFDGPQFVDLNGDGRVDYVAMASDERHAWYNDGSKFVERPEWLPEKRKDMNHAFFIDMDADGMVDEVILGTGVETSSGSGGLPEPSMWRKLGVNLNRLKQGGTWGYAERSFTKDWWPISAGRPFKDVPVEIADVDGNGRPDLVRVIVTRYNQNCVEVPVGPPACVDTTPAEAYLDVNLNVMGDVGDTPSVNYTIPSSIVAKIKDFQLEDMNRDGLADLVSRPPLGTTITVIPNRGFNGAFGSVWGDVYTVPQECRQRPDRVPPAT